MLLLYEVQHQPLTHRQLASCTDAATQNTIILKTWCVVCFFCSYRTATNRTTSLCYLLLYKFQTGWVNLQKKQVVKRQWLSRCAHLHVLTVLLQNCRKNSKNGERGAKSRQFNRRQSTEADASPTCFLFFAQFLYALADERRSFPGSRSSLNTSELKGSSVSSVVQQQPLHQQALISFLSATAIMSQQQSNTKQLLRKPKKSEIRQMGLRCSRFLTFCSSSSVFIHADVELLAELFFSLHTSVKKNSLLHVLSLTMQL